MKKSILTSGILSMSGILALAIILALLFTNLSANNIPKAATMAQSMSIEKSSCENLSEFLKDEYLKDGKAKGNIRIIGVQEKDALAKAINVCAKLNAKQITSNSDDLVYQLPDGLGHIILQEVYEGNLFIRMTFDSACRNLPFIELHFVSLKYYNSK